MSAADPLRFTFTEAKLRSITKPDGRVRYRDTQVPGLVLRVTAGPASQRLPQMAFAYRQKVEGRDVEVTIGRWPTVTVEAARKRAKEIAQAPAQVAERRRARLAEGTVAEAWASHLRVYGRDLRPSTRRDYDLAWKLLVEPVLGSRRVSDVTPADCRRMLNRAAEKHGEAMARKAVVVASLLFTALCDDPASRLPFNPTRGLERPHIEPRRRFFDSAELGALLRGLDAEAPLWRVFWLCCLMAPLRRGNIAAAKWSDLMLDPPSPRWLVDAENAKGGKLLAMPIAEPLAKVLRDWKDANPGAVYVFPAGLTAGPRKESNHIVSVQHAWKRALQFGTAVRICDAIADKSGGNGRENFRQFLADVESERQSCMGEHRPRPGNPVSRVLERLCAQAKSAGIDAEALRIKDAKPHDLRRTAASWAVQGGASMAIVSASLGHSDTRITEEHYAHLSDSPVRGMLDANALRIIAAREVKP